MSPLNATREDQRQKPPSVLLGPPATGEAPLGDSDEFYERHQRRRYVMDFYRSKEYLMKNSDSIKQRVLEAIKLTAWANYRDYAADEKGRPLSMTAIAGLIGSTPQRVSEACEALEAEYLIRIVNRIIFLVDDPILERIEAERRRKRESNFDPSGKESPKPTRNDADGVAEALAYLKSTDPTWFTEYQKVDDRFQEAAEDRKRWRCQAVERFHASRPHQDFEAVEEEVFRPGRKTEEPEKFPDGSENSSGPVGKQPSASLYGFKGFIKLASYQEGTPERAVDEVIVRSGLRDLPGNRNRAIRAAAGRIATLAPSQLSHVLPHFEYDCSQLAARRANKPKNWGIVVTVMEDAIVAVRHAPPEPATPTEGTKTATEPNEEQRRQWEAALADPNATEKEKELARICLGLEAAERKPAASEGGEQAQKAGEA